jgi:hypothetical protein
MRENLEITIRIPVEWVQEINDLFKNKELKLQDFLPKPRSIEAFVYQAIQNEMHDLNYCAGVRLQISSVYNGVKETNLRHFVEH